MNEHHDEELKKQAVRRFSKQQRKSVSVEQFSQLTAQKTQKAPLIEQLKENKWELYVSIAQLVVFIIL